MQDEFLIEFLCAKFCFQIFEFCKNPEQWATSVAQPEFFGVGSSNPTWGELELPEPFPPPLGPRHWLPNDPLVELAEIRFGI